MAPSRNLKRKSVVRLTVEQLECRCVLSTATPELHTMLVSNDTHYTNGKLWGMYGDETSPNNAFGSQAGEAWAAGYVGSNNVYVAVIDEGIDFNHPDLAANIWTNPYDPVDGVDNDGNGYKDDLHGWDFYSDNNSVFDGTATNGVDAHGTHVAGTIGAVGGNGIGVAGVNWNVTVISAKFLGPNGGYISDAVDAVRYVTNLKNLHPEMNIVAMNNSWGGGGYSSAMQNAIVDAGRAGILFVAAAGNSGSNNDARAYYPANYSTQAALGYETVISVAAIDKNGKKPSWSSYGKTQVDLGAPGVAIVSTTPGGSYSSYSGTSMATPHVTGAAALYASLNPGKTAAQIRAAILNNTVATTSMQNRTVTGGRLNVAKMLGLDPGTVVISGGASGSGGSSGGSSSGGGLRRNDIIDASEEFSDESATPIQLPGSIPATGVFVAPQTHLAAATTAVVVQPATPFTFFSVTPRQVFGWGSSTLVGDWQPVNELPSPGVTFIEASLAPMPRVEEQTTFIPPADSLELPVAPPVEEAAPSVPAELQSPKLPGEVASPLFGLVIALSGVWMPAPTGRQRYRWIR